MITLEKLNLYLKYNGDIDMFARVNDKKELQILSEEEWYKIDNLLQEAYLVQSRKVSEAFKLEIESRLDSEISADTMKFFNDAALQEN